MKTGPHPEVDRSRATPERYHLLDALRGIAALAVMLNHYCQYAGFGRLLGGAYAAVDLFFMLSGFVLAHAYGERIRAGLTFAEFGWLRIRRLGPIYVLGIVLGVLSIAVAIRVSGAGNYALLLRQALPALLALPWFDALPWPLGPGPWPMIDVFPINLPRWTLFFELLAGCALHVYLRQLGRLPGPLITILLWITYWGLILLTRKTNVGFLLDNFSLGIPRVLCDFAIGAWILSVQGGLRIERPRTCTALIAGVLLLMLVPSHTVAALNAGLVVPMCLLLAAGLRIEGRLRAISHWLGRISYPLYLIHTPVWGLMASLTTLGAAPLWLQLIVVGALAVFAAELASRAEIRLLQRPRPEEAARTLQWRKYG